MEVRDEIVKALEWCEQFENNIVFKGSGDERCVQALQMMVVIKHALKEYNRQKAEIERLRGPSRAYHFCNLLGGCLVFSKSLKDYNDMRKGIESEARKEFWEQIKAMYGLDENDIIVAVNIKEIDDILAERESAGE